MHAHKEEVSRNMKTLTRRAVEHPAAALNVWMGSSRPLAEQQWLACA